MKLPSIRSVCINVITIYLVTLVGFTPAEGAETAKDQVAVVNGTVITRQALESEVARAKNRMVAQGQPGAGVPTEKMDQKILDQLIDMEILLQESQKQKIQITDKTVADHLAKFKARFPSAEAYQKALKDLNVSEVELKEKTMKGLAVQALIEKQVTSKIEISDTDRRSFYDSNPNFFKQPEQVEARHILIKLDPAGDEAQQAKAIEKIKKIQQEVKAGEDFAALAKEYSEGPSATNGGDLGFFGRGQMVKPFEDAAFNLKTGQVSDIVKTQFGYHLIMVTGKKAGSTISYEEANDKIGTHLKQQKSSELIAAYIETLKKEAKIEKSL